MTSDVPTAFLRRF